MDNTSPISQPVSEQLFFATFSKRLAACVIDCLLLGIIFLPLTILFLNNSGIWQLIEMYEKLPKGSGELIAFVYPNYAILVQNAVRETIYFSLILLALTMVYFALWESSKKQATPGKLAMKIMVWNAKGKHISFIRALSRNFCKIFSVATLMLGYLMPLWTKHKQALHDQMTNCFVLKS